MPTNTITIPEIQETTETDTFVLNIQIIRFLCFFSNEMHGRVFKSSLRFHPRVWIGTNGEAFRMTPGQNSRQGQCTKVQCSQKKDKCSIMYIQDRANTCTARSNYTEQQNRWSSCVRMQSETDPGPKSACCENKCKLDNGLGKKRKRCKLIY